jgi:hypothetical protein
MEKKALKKLFWRRIEGSEVFSRMALSTKSLPCIFLHRESDVSYSWFSISVFHIILPLLLLFHIHMQRAPAQKLRTIFVL